MRGWVLCEVRGWQCCIVNIYLYNMCELRQTRHIESEVEATWGFSGTIYFHRNSHLLISRYQIVLSSAKRAGSVGFFVYVMLTIARPAATCIRGHDHRSYGYKKSKAAVLLSSTPEHQDIINSAPQFTNHRAIPIWGGKKPVYPQDYLLLWDMPLFLAAFFSAFLISFSRFFNLRPVRSLPRLV